MLRRHHWRFIALLLPLLFLCSGSGASGFTSQPQVNSSALFFEGQPLDHRHGIATGASELADEEGPPKKAYRANTTVLWPRDSLSTTGHEMAPSYVCGAPVACAARPRAPPALF
jgi:hypothetical protein